VKHDAEMIKRDEEVRQIKEQEEELRDLASAM
jgi:hypothetical protein